MLRENPIPSTLIIPVRVAKGASSSQTNTYVFGFHHTGVLNNTIISDMDNKASTIEDIRQQQKHKSGEASSKQDVLIPSDDNNNSMKKRKSKSRGEGLSIGGSSRGQTKTQDTPSPACGAGSAGSAAPVSISTTRSLEMEGTTEKSSASRSKIGESQTTGYHQKASTRGTIGKLDQHFAQEDPQSKLPGTTIATDPTAPLSPSESTSSLTPHQHHQQQQQHPNNKSNKNLLLDHQRFTEASPGVCSPPPPLITSGSQSPGWRIRENRKNAAMMVLATATATASVSCTPPSTKSSTAGTTQRKRMLKNTDNNSQLPDALRMAAAFSPKSPRKLRVVKKLDKDECLLRRRSSSNDRDYEDLELINNDNNKEQTEKEIQEGLKNEDTAQDAIQRLRKARRKKRPTAATTIATQEEDARDTIEQQLSAEPARRKSEGDKRAPHNRRGVAHHKAENATDDLLGAALSRRSERNSNNNMVDRVPTVVSWHSRKQQQATGSSTMDDEDLSIASFNSSLTPSVHSNKELNLNDDDDCCSQEHSNQKLEIANMVLPMDALSPRGLSSPLPILKPRNGQPPAATESPSAGYLNTPRMQPRPRPSDSSPSVPQRFSSVNVEDESESESALQVPKNVSLRNSLAVHDDDDDDAPSDEDSVQVLLEDSMPIKPEKHVSVEWTSEEEHHSSSDLVVQDLTSAKPMKHPSVPGLQVSQQQQQQQRIGDHHSSKKDNLQPQDSMPVKPQKQLSVMPQDGDDLERIRQQVIGCSRPIIGKDVSELFNKDAMPVKLPEKHASNIRNTMILQDDPEAATSTAPVAPRTVSPCSSSSAARKRTQKSSTTTSKLHSHKDSSSSSSAKEKDEEKKAKLAAAAELLKHKISQMNEEMRLMRSSSSTHTHTTTSSTASSVTSTTTRTSTRSDVVQPKKNHFHQCHQLVEECGSPRRCKSAVVGSTDIMEMEDRRTKKDKKGGSTSRRSSLSKNKGGSSSKRSLSSQEQSTSRRSSFSKNKDGSSSKRSLSSQEQPPGGEEESPLSSKERGRKPKKASASDPGHSDSESCCESSKSKKKRGKDKSDIRSSSSHSSSSSKSSSSKSSSSKSATKSGGKSVSSGEGGKEVRSRSHSPSSTASGKAKRQPKSLLQPDKLAPWQIKEHRVAPVVSLYNRSLDDDEKDEEDPTLPPAFRNNNKTKKPKTKMTNRNEILQREKRRGSVLESLDKFNSKKNDASDLPPAFRHLLVSKPAPKAATKD